MQEQKETEVLDLRQYGYAPSQKVEVDGNLFLYVLKMFGLIVQQESKTYFEVKDTYSETVGSQKEFLTELGIDLTVGMGQLENIHRENVLNGSAKHLKDLAKLYREGGEVAEKLKDIPQSDSPFDVEETKIGGKSETIDV